MRADRLLQLADFLETDRVKEHFDYSTWVGDSWEGHPDLSCGTTGCALGWATVLFPDLLRACRPRWDSIPRICLVEDSSILGACAAKRAFDISLAQAEFLFVPDEEWMNDVSIFSPPADAPASEVAAHIRRCVEMWKDL
jgi:hypothetical protein